MWRIREDVGLARVDKSVDLDAEGVDAKAGH